MKKVLSPLFSKRGNGSEPSIFRRMSSSSSSSSPSSPLASDASSSSSSTVVVGTVTANSPGSQNLYFASAPQLSAWLSLATHRKVIVKCTARECLKMTPEELRKATGLKDSEVRSIGLIEKIKEDMARQLATAEVNCLVIPPKLPEEVAREHLAERDEGDAPDYSWVSSTTQVLESINDTTTGEELQQIMEDVYKDIDDSQPVSKVNSDGLQDDDGEEVEISVGLEPPELPPLPPPQLHSVRRAPLPTPPDDETEQSAPSEEAPRPPPRRR